MFLEGTAADSSFNGAFEDVDIFEALRIYDEFNRQDGMDDLEDISSPVEFLPNASLLRQLEKASSGLNDQVKKIDD